MTVVNNLVCPICGKAFHRKPSVIAKAVWKDGICCSLECSREIRKTKYKGESNHQFGLRGKRNPTFIDRKIFRKNNKLTEVMIYVGEWYNGAEHGRVKEHRYVVELNYLQFGEDKFEEINGWHYLKKGYVVHHLDHNHSNNSLTNLTVLSKAEHTRLHNLANPRKRNSKGQFII